MSDYSAKTLYKNEETARTIGENIKKERRKKGISAKELADKVGVQKSTISNYEHFRSTPRYEILHKICEVLDIPPAKIVSVGKSGFFEPTKEYTDCKIPLYDSIADLTDSPDIPSAYYPPLPGFDGKDSFILQIQYDCLADAKIPKDSFVVFCSDAEIKIGKILVLNIGGTGCFAKILSANSDTIGVCIFESENKSRLAEIPLGDPCILGISAISIAFC